MTDIRYQIPDKVRISIFLVLLGVVSRIVPHPANFTMVGGMTVYLGKTKQSVFVPLVSMLLADLILGFDSVAMRMIIYGSIVLMYLAGRQIKNLWLASIVGSFLFFITSNIGVWLTSTMYEKTVWGLTQSLYMALPFWRNALIADILFAQAFKFGDILISSETAASTTSNFMYSPAIFGGLFLELLFPGRKHNDKRHHKKN